MILTFIAALALQVSGAQSHTATAAQEIATMPVVVTPFGPWYISITGWADEDFQCAYASPFDHRRGQMTVDPIHDRHEKFRMCVSTAHPDTVVFERWIASRRKWATIYTNSHSDKEGKP
jgi:hypothetical protein